MIGTTPSVATALKRPSTTELMHACSSSQRGNQLATLVHKRRLWCGAAKEASVVSTTPDPAWPAYPQPVTAEEKTLWRCYTTEFACLAADSRPISQPLLGSLA